MLITTTNNFENRKIKEYLDIVFGEVVEGIDIVKDFKASFTNIFGGRSGSYEDSVAVSRRAAIEEMISNARKLKADAIVSIKIDYETIGSMLMIIASGTAVTLEEE